MTSDPAGMSDEKCTCVNNRCIRSKISGYQRITLTVEGLNWVRIVKLARSRWTSNYYITYISSEQSERRCWNENHVPAEAKRPGPRLSSPRERKRNAAMARRVGVNMLQFCSVSNSPLTNNTFRNPFEPFQIKCEVYFSNELCSLVFIVLNMFLHASAYEYVTVARDNFFWELNSLLMSCLIFMVLCQIKVGIKFRLCVMSQKK